MKQQNGSALMELVVVISIIGLFAAVSGMAIDDARRRTSLAAATSEMRSIFYDTRATAMALDRNVAIRFQYDGEDWTYGVYEDGDGDGVRNDDIRRGRDPVLVRPRRLMYADARIGLPRKPLPDPSTGRPLSTRSAVRFNASSLCSFSRAGEATSGSVVLTDGTRAVMLRIQGTAGRISVLRWNGSAWQRGI